jgi:selenide, water dikinase
METLNRAACEAMLEVGVHACTDITGFSLMGHALELAEASGVLVEIDAAALPVYPQVREMAALGLVPAGSYSNRDHYLPQVLEEQGLPPEVLDILADPQTSGGLLMAVAAERLEDLLAGLRKRGANGWVIGRVKDAPAGRMRVA